MVVTWMTSHYKLVSATGLVWFGYIHLSPPLSCLVLSLSPLILCVFASVSRPAGLALPGYGYGYILGPSPVPPIYLRG